ncbi:MAG: amino acid adenylation domain-containing protein, partial [Bacteroidales bacterium]|nr:amino acid adenylation domain-containing protein [Bacteroidales bacterium]
MEYTSLFRQSAAKWPSRTALVDRNGERSTSYSQLDRLSGQVAGKLKAQGLGKGDFILVNNGRCMEYIASYLGVLKAGCIVVPVVPDYPEDRVEFIRSDCGARLAITQEFFSDIENYEPFYSPAEGAEPALLAYTSGSTGTPKGMLFSTADLARTAIRHESVFGGVSPVIYAGAALFSFLLHLIEYLTVLSIGGTTHILDDSVRKSAVSLAAYYRKHGITTGIITPQMLRLYRNEDPSLQRVITCGERLSRVAPQDYELLNGYGMSETLAFVTTFRVTHGYDNTPVGKSMEGVSVSVLDDNMNPVPDGTEGEICALGEFDTVYFKDPERTSRTMEKMPDGKTRIHTGDIGYVNPDGDIVYSNRKDWMVKVNGQRVETLEIESRLMDIPEIGNAAVKAFEDADSQNYLVAFYVEKEEIGTDDLRRELARNLPEYMIPRFFVKKDELPRNPNGKLDRKALAPPAADSFKTVYRAPADALESAVCQAFESVLHCGTVGADDDFFSLGGDSIKVLRLLQEIPSAELTPEIIFKSRTPRTIAALCHSPRRSPIEHLEDIPDFCPLSDSQLGVYLDCVSEPDSSKYNIPVLCELPSGTDTDRFKEAVRTVAARHRALHVTVTEQGGVPGMKISERETAITEMDTDDFDSACRELVRPLDLSSGPLYRFWLLNSPQGVAFFFDIHHIVFDGTSVTEFLSQIASVYEGGECPGEEALNQFDIALDEVSFRQGDIYAGAEDFFRQRFEGMDCDSTPVPDKTFDDGLSGAGHVTACSEGINAADAVHFARTHSITENTLFLGAFAYTLAKFNGAAESFFCTVDNGRHDPRLAGSTGMFVRTLPVYMQIDENAAVGEFLTGVRDEFFGTMEHDCISFSSLASQYGIGMSVSFVYQAEMFSGPEMAGGRMKVRMPDTSDIQSDLHLMLYRSGDGYTLNLGYDRKLYSEAFASRFAATFFQVVRSMMKAATLKEIELADESARRAVTEFNRTEVPYESGSTVVELFRRRASENPDAPCLVFGDRKFSYGLVDRISDSIASRILGSGLPQGSVVGILIPRCEHMLLSSLGVLKARCAYLPMDPTYPEERLNLMFRDSGAAMLITTPELSHLVSDEFTGPRIMTAELDEPLADCGTLPRSKPEDKFVILYTSGSTGTPKGVVFTHANTMVTASWEQRFYTLGPGCNVTAYASFGFDANVFDTYATIISGACLHIISDEIRLDLPVLRKYFNDNGITHTTMTTQVGRQFAQMGGFTTLRFISVAGEKLTPLTPPEGILLCNLYGPTEGSIVASGFTVDKLYRDIPIGKAVDNVKLYVVDSFGRLLPPGAAGELWISGAHVTAGYLNRPEKTAEAYGKNPFCSDEGYGRIYRTGDVVRFLEDGNLQFIGRKDAQVKVRGFRVELTEVEEVVRRFDGIRDATVAAFDDPAGGKFIAAYVVSDSTVDIEALNEFIRSEKPPYMVPAVTMQIDRIPLNQNQKVNRKALPVPRRKLENLVPPQNDTQKKICAIVADVLGHESFGIDTNLFEVGLTSIAVLKLNVRLGTLFDVSVRIDDIKSNETVRKLEKMLLGSERDESYEILPDYPLTQTQMGIFVECNSSQGSITYNIPMLFRLGPGIDADRLSDAVKAAIDAHPYAKTTLFADEEGNVRARRNDDAPVNVEIEMLERVPEGSELVRPFRLLDSPLYRASVIRTPEGDCLFLDFHHIISDGMSQAILLSDIDRAYAGEKLEREKYTGFEAALDEEKMRMSPRYAEAEGYYRNLLSGCETECLPPKSPERGSSDAGDEAGRLSVSLSVKADSVHTFCAAGGLTMNAFFNSVFGYTLCRFTNRKESVFTTIYNGRNDSRLSSTFTMRVKT